MNNCVRSCLDAEVFYTILTQVFCIAPTMVNVINWFHCLAFVSSSKQESDP